MRQQHNTNVNTNANTNARTEQPAKRDFDWGVVDPEAKENLKEQYPKLTWIYGNRKGIGMGEKSLMYTGGLMWTNAPEDIEIPGWEHTYFINNEGKKVEGLASLQPTVSVITRRERWWEKGPDGKSRPLAKGDFSRDGNGIRFSTLQLLCFIQGYDKPFVITGSSNKAKYLKAVHDEYRKVAEVANRTAPPDRKLQSFAFWMTMRPDKHSMVGTDDKKSEVTFPMIVLPDKITRDYAFEVYVGPKLHRKFQDFFKSNEVKEWFAAWDILPTEKEIEEMNMPAFKNKEHERAFAAQADPSRNIPPPPVSRYNDEEPPYPESWDEI